MPFTDIFTKFVSVFPQFLQPYVSVLVGVFLVITVIQIIRRQFVWLIALVILLPSSLAILRSVGNVLADVLRFLFTWK